jgi:hypothetical protein
MDLKLVIVQLPRSEPAHHFFERWTTARPIDRCITTTIRDNGDAKKKGQKGEEASFPLPSEKVLRSDYLFCAGTPYVSSGVGTCSHQLLP